jgi:hypothetical protein
MVRIIIMGFSLLLFLSVCAGAQDAKRDAYDGGEKYGEVRPYKVTPVKKVVIKEKGKWSKMRSSSDETPEDCAKFNLKEQDVREFFQRARRVSRATYSEYLDISRCYAIGEITFANGDRGVWIIDPFRRGSLALSDGRNIYFFCTKCRAKVFYEY